MATLIDNTVVEHPETGERVTLFAGQEIPDWAEDLIGGHLVEAAAETSDEPDDLPPTSGKGSGVEAWAKYADAKGIAYPEGANRDEIIAAVDAHQAEQ